MQVREFDRMVYGSAVGYSELIVFMVFCGKPSAATAVEEFGHEVEYGTLFIETLRVFTVSEAMSAMSSSYTCDQEPELAEAYMNFTSMFVRCCPKVHIPMG